MNRTVEQPVWEAPIKYDTIKRQENMPHLDIIIYGLIAVVLLARLWTVFGRRNEDDPQRPNPFATPAPDRRDDREDAMPSNGENAAKSNFTPILMAPNSLAGTLDRIRQADPSFDEKEFLRQTRTIFTSAIEAFAKGDLTPVKARLSPAVAASFDAAITERRKAGETLENRVVRINDAETASASMDDTKAAITVRFVSEQQNVLRDAEGKVISGTPGQAEEITDLWTFGRDLQPSSSDWRLIETKS